MRLDCKRWENLLTRRECLKRVRSLHVHGALQPQAPSRFHHSRKSLLAQAEWQESCPDEFNIHEQETFDWENDHFHVLAKLIVKLPFLERLQWAAIDQVPDCILATLSALRTDLRLEMPEWRLSYRSRFESDPDQNSSISCAQLRSLTARLMPEDMNRDVLLRMLGGFTPSLEEVRIIECEEMTSFDVHPSDRVRQRKLEDIYRRNEQKSKARLKLFSIHGKKPVETAELEQWFAAADMSRLQRLELRSGVDSAEVWKSTFRPQSLPHLRELLLGFNIDCTLEEQEAATEWLERLCQTNQNILQTLELYGNIPSRLNNIASLSRGWTLRALTFFPQPHSGPFTLRFGLPSGLTLLSSLCPLLESLTIPIGRGQSLGNEYYETQTYTAFSQFAKLTNLHILLDYSRWGEFQPWEMIQESINADEEPTYLSLDGRRITHRHVRDAFVHSAVDEKLSRTIWELVTKGKKGMPLSELHVEPCGSMEIIRGFRPDDRPELASRLVDLYAILREVSRSYKISRHVRDDVHDLVVREPPGAIPRGHWSRVDEAERERGEVVCHLEGVEMEIFQSIWPRKEGSKSWRDDWESLELVMPEDGEVNGMK